MPAKLHKLINFYDSIGWIPTIRGCLSLELIDDAKSILGDVDKYSIRFKYINKFHSSHYLIASSLHTTNDSKVGENYVRSFRYIFLGAINDKEITQVFLNQDELKGDEDLTSYINEEGLLIGRLIIVAEETRNLSDLEVTLLKGLEELTVLSKNHKRNFYVNAASMAVLEAERAEMLKQWRNLRTIVQEIEVDTKNRRPTFCFDVALTRDGILLLKDVTRNEDRMYYAAPNTPDDYTQNTPIHRLFKIAMNYVKFLFHSNYHHNDDHDNYLPASNLHPIRNLGEQDLQRVFKHQLDAFFLPVIKLKRGGFENFTVKPEGIMLYAKTFIRVFESHELVRSDVIKKAKDYSDILEKEIVLMTSRNNVLVNALITQHNFFIILSGLLAFVFTCLKLISIFVVIPQLTIDEIKNITNIHSSRPLFAIGSVVILAIFGFVCYEWPRLRILNKQFHTKPREKSRLFKWLFQNSCLDEGKFSCRYGLYIDLCTKILKLGNKRFQLLKLILWFVFMLVSFSSILFIIIK